MDPVVAFPIILTLGTFKTPLEMFRRLYYLITIVKGCKTHCALYCVFFVLRFAFSTYQSLAFGTPATSEGET
jgi:hypothetical protein